MTKLRGRLLITLVLAAVSLSAIGVGNASAKVRSTSPGVVQSVKPRAPIGPFSGEPDAGNGTLPKQSTPTNNNPGDPSEVAAEALALLWALWLGRH